MRPAYYSWSVLVVCCICHWRAVGPGAGWRALQLWLCCGSLQHTPKVQLCKCTVQNQPLAPVLSDGCCPRAEGPSLSCAASCFVHRLIASGCPVFPPTRSSSPAQRCAYQVSCCTSLVVSSLLLDIIVHGGSGPSGLETSPFLSPNIPEGNLHACFWLSGRHLLSGSDCTILHCTVLCSCRVLPQGPGGLPLLRTIIPEGPLHGFLPATCLHLLHCAVLCFVGCCPRG